MTINHKRKGHETGDGHQQQLGNVLTDLGLPTRTLGQLQRQCQPSGSGVYPEDGGTSAACPVAAGVVAAIRSKYPVSKLSPLQLKSLIFKSAEDKAGTGFDFDYGWGILDAGALLAALP
jgi:subtilisin family serine protease